MTRGFKLIKEKEKLWQKSNNSIKNCLPKNLVIQLNNMNQIEVVLNLVQ